VIDGQVDVPINVRLNVRFDEMISHWKTATISLMDAASNTQSINVSLIRNRSVLSVVPQQLLAANTQYTLSVSGIKDISGNELASAYSFTFTTKGTADFIDGAITSWPIPQNNTKGVALNPLLVVDFNEMIDITSVDTSTFYLQNVTTNTRVLGDWSISTDRTSLTFSPSGLLAAGNTHYLYVGHSPYLTDLAGNRVALNQSRYFVTGTEEDTLALSVEALSIPDEQMDVPVNARIVIEFDQPLSNVCDPTTGVSLKNEGNNVDINAVVDNTRRILTVTPVNHLLEDANFELAVVELCDYSGNTLSGDIGSFTTINSTAEDTSAPQFVSSVPAHQATGIALDANIVLTFDEDLDVRSRPTLKQGNTVVTADVTVNGNVVTINPTENLIADTQYVIDISYNAVDFIGNTRYLGTKSFTTAP
jgi:hypothetical protein